MTSELTKALIVNGVVLITVLASDLGPDRKIGRMRILRPLIAAAVIIPLFVKQPVGHGTGLTVELAGAAAGLLAGVVVGALMHVYRHPITGAPVSRAGSGYAAVWVLIIGARTAFSYGAAHWFTLPLVNWAIAHDVSIAAVTDGLIFMAIIMVVARTASLAVRAARITPAEPTAPLAAGSAK
ncbi:hypothetical protein [Leekyejoonella antrihumi]|uniref:DUF1453 family protein n=1 Tax=Leekyejoonella antrihumi TaxID=1660198 RepID=A0A563E446_9MICO|nr:hypothetical protein [Leekyejoonella antrihumi]TWP36644.1 hypothetical protein FGL98_09310 [Leekyejoonella antrihumi]